jgi:hypothetical protein
MTSRVWWLVKWSCIGPRWTVMDCVATRCNTLQHVATQVLVESFEMGESVAHFLSRSSSTEKVQWERDALGNWVASNRCLRQYIRGRGG